MYLIVLRQFGEVFSIAKTLFREGDDPYSMRAGEPRTGEGGAGAETGAVAGGAGAEAGTGGRAG